MACYCRTAYVLFSSPSGDLASVTRQLPAASKKAETVKRTLKQAAAAAYHPPKPHLLAGSPSGGMVLTVARQ